MVVASHDIISRFGTDTDPELRAIVTTARCNQALAFGRLGRSEDAISVWDEVIDGAFEPSESWTLLSRRRRLPREGPPSGQELGRFDEARAAYLELVSRYREEVDPEGTRLGQRRAPCAKRRTRQGRTAETRHPSCTRSLRTGTNVKLDHELREAIATRLLKQHITLA